MFPTSVPRHPGTLSAAVTATVGLFLLLGAGPAAAEIRFSTPQTATKVAGHYEHVYQEIPNIYDQGSCLYGIGGDYYDSVRKVCIFDYYSYVPGYLTGPKRGDILHFAPSASAGVAAKIQMWAFPNHPLIIHTAVCSASTSTTCTQVWENTAISDFAALVPDKSCNPAVASDFALIPPGLRWANPLADSYGTIKYARPKYQSMIDTWYTNSMSHTGPNYGGSYWYKISGYSRYKPYSMCSESASDAMGLNADEGDARVDLSSSHVASVLSNAESEIREVCFDSLPWEAWFCNLLFKSRNHICHDLAHEVLNAFMDETWRGEDSPVARRLYGMTAPADQHCHIAGTCPTPPPPPTGYGY